MKGTPVQAAESSDDDSEDDSDDDEEDSDEEGADTTLGDLDSTNNFAEEVVEQEIQ